MSVQIGSETIADRARALPGRSLQDLVNSQPGWLCEGNANFIREVPSIRLNLWWMAFRSPTTVLRVTDLKLRPTMSIL